MVIGNLLEMNIVAVFVETEISITIRVDVKICIYTGIAWYIFPNNAIYSIHN